jgi:hypothetical protein
MPVMAGSRPAVVFKVMLVGLGPSLRWDDEYAGRRLNKPAEANLGEQLGLDRPVFGVALGRRVDVHPLPRTVGPDVHDEFHIIGRIEAADLEHHHLRDFFPLAVDRRAAVAAEIPVEDISALGGIGKHLGLTRGKGHGARRDQRVITRTGAGGFLAMGAMAGDDVVQRLAHCVADLPAQATTGNRVGHERSSFARSESAWRAQYILEAQVSSLHRVDLRPSTKSRLPAKTERSRHVSTATQRHLFILSSHMRTDSQEAPTMNQAVIVNQDALGISIVRTGVSVE